MKPSEKALLSEINVFVEQNISQMLSMLKELISIPTENPPGKNYIEIAELLSKTLRGLGYETELVWVPNELAERLAPHGEGLPRVNLIARMKGAIDRPVVHLNGHFDVVPAGEGWSLDPFVGIVRNGKVYGRGSSDMKSGIVSQIFAVEALRYASKKLGLNVRGMIEHSFTCDEETGGFAGLGYLVEAGYVKPGWLAHMCITEPTEARFVVVGHRGLVWFQIRTRGRKSHAGKAKLSVNAIDNMVTLISRIMTDLRPKVEARRTYNVVPEEGCISTITPTFINAGLALNVVPDICLAKFDRRLSTDETVEGVLREVEEVLKAVSEEQPELRYDLERIMTVDPVRLPTDTRIARVVQESVTEVIGVTPEFRVLAATFDMKFLADAGMKECIAYGPGGVYVGHATDEYVTTSNLTNATKVLAFSLGKLLLEDSKKLGGPQ